MAQNVSSGAHLHCHGCGTQLRVEQVGGGTMECCGEPLGTEEHLGSVMFETSAEIEPHRHVQCSGCGNRAGLLHDGGGKLVCCNKPMAARRKRSEGL